MEYTWTTFCCGAARTKKLYSVMRRLVLNSNLKYYYTNRKEVFESNYQEIRLKCFSACVMPASDAFFVT